VLFLNGVSRPLKPVQNSVYCQWDGLKLTFNFNILLGIYQNYSAAFALGGTGSPSTPQPAVKAKRAAINTTLR
jgi:hypothetical protein